MKHDYNLKFEDREALRSLLGKRLVSYRLNETDGTSFEVFVLRLEAEDIEVGTREIVGMDDWFDETNTVEVRRRPNRDSWSRLGESAPPNGIPAGGFMDYAVGEIVTGVSVAVDGFSDGAEMGEYVRGLVLELGARALVFDKGPQNWADIWHVRKCPASEVSFSVAAFDPMEEPNLRSETRLERIA